MAQRQQLPWHVHLHASAPLRAVIVFSRQVLCEAECGTEFNAFNINQVSGRCRADVDARASESPSCVRACGACGACGALQVVF